MGIATKKGDDGYTSLCDGSRISKAHLRIEFGGMIDELCSFLGLSKSLIRNKKIRNNIESIQRDLFVIGTESASRSPILKKLRRRINARDVERLDRLIDQLEDKKKFNRCFYLPGENLVSATLDIARVVARRVECCAVRLKAKGILKNQHILAYLNRASDLLYLLARASERKPRRLK